MINSFCCVLISGKYRTKIIFSLFFKKMSFDPIGIFFLLRFTNIVISSITLNAKHQLYLNSALHSLFIPLATQTRLDYAISVFRLFGSKKRKKVSKQATQAVCKIIRSHQRTYSGVCKSHFFFFSI